ncbi:MAG: topoisomerase C-terminal repeat-containing protein [Clostridia bacterium]|nr:topoisomerase C-terminal repeat-containing protein [Clostridia bacterium]
MKLIIAEKPSLARNIVAGIGEMSKRNGFFENKEYIVTWAFGHLFSLCDIEDYQGKNGEKVRWSMEGLPCFPPDFRFKLKLGEDKKPDAGVEKQFALIKTLCGRNDVDTIINAGDADREGEIIVRLCVEATGVKGKKFLRLWLPDQTPQTVAAALADMKEESEYDNLANEGLARTYIDWLYGVNLTRYATLKTGSLLRVGRVIVPIVKAVHERDESIKNFVPEIYYAMASNEKTNGEAVDLLSKNKFSKDEHAKALETCAEYNATGAYVLSKKIKNDTLAPGKLYSLTKLQNVLGKKHKMSMEKSLAVLQGLYEKGFVTYPRTNSEYLATAEQGKMKTIIENVKKLGYPVEFKNKKTIFDDSKIESHSALTPTYKIPDKNALTEDERIIYSTIMRRFVAVFCAEECKVQKTELKIAVGELETFTLKGVIIKEPGWTKYDDYTQKDKILPNLEKGDKVNIDFKPTEKETSPPKHYTIETLNNYLKNPFREDKAQAEKDKEKEAEGENAQENDEEDYRAIFEGLELGTEATRTGIIDNAKKSGYIALKKDVYTILPGGEFLIEQLSHLGISMDKYKTSELGKALKSVYRGKMSVQESVGLAEAEIAKVFERERGQKELPPETDEDTGFFGDIIGKCPVCGKDIMRGKWSYGCLGYKEGCTFRINFYICKRAISVSNAKLLLETGKTSKIKGFTSKKNTLFDAQLKLDEEKKVVFDF